MKMKVDIWSDVRCPFCYIGKRKFEEALEQFPQRNHVEVEWHSFQLDPTLKTRTDINTLDYFEETKGVSREQAQQMLTGATQMAKEVGIDFNLEKSVVANSLNAHRLIQMAKKKDLGNEIEEALFHAHFVETKNIDDVQTLAEVGNSIGIKKEEIEEMLASGDFEYEVKQDEMQAQNIGVRGVPFFVIDNKYGISGAQPVEVFLETLQKAWKEQKNINLNMIDGDSCSTDGNCH